MGCRGRGGRNKAERLRTQTTGSDVGSDHDGRTTRLELGENPITLLLLLVTVNGQCGPPVDTEELCELVRDALGADEDEHLGRLGRNLLEVLDKPARVSSRPVKRKKITHFPRFS